MAACPIRRCRPRGDWWMRIAALPNQQIDKMIPFMAARYGADVFVPYFAGNDQITLLTRKPAGAFSATT
jgi:hypothetical protein